MPDNETPEQKAAREAAEAQANQEAAAEEKARLKKHREEESGNWVTVKKGDEVLEINKACLAAHKALGWKEV